MRTISMYCVCAVLLTALPVTARAQDAASVSWRHLSTVNGDLPVPNGGDQQTASLVLDIDMDGVNDFVITERTEAPAVVWYRRTGSGWDRYTIEAGPLHIEAGAATTDIDGDGDPDIVFGGDYMSHQVWWWENPYPDFAPSTPWVRHVIKDFGETKHHDQMFGDFNGDGRDELVFWNQKEQTLFHAEIPAHPRSVHEWVCIPVYRWSEDSEMVQRGTYPGWRKPNEHEGFDKADIDGDGVDDIVGGGRWFKHIGDNRFLPNIIDASYAFSRSAAGQLVEGGRPEVVLVVGDGRAPLILYEWDKGTWLPTVLVEAVQDGHSLDIVDFNGDGHLDIFCAEMRLGQNPVARTMLLLGDGAGGFTESVVTTGFGLHESGIADLDGDGDYDILGKPYTWEAPRLDIWLNEGR